MLEARRTLPGRDVTLPTLGFGGAALGGMHGAVSEAEAAETLRDAWDAGIRYFDTAPLYGHGLGELRSGAALRERARDDYVISTKTGWLIEPLAEPDKLLPPGVLRFARRIDYSFDATLRSVEASLLRLGIEHIDLVFVHDVDPYNHGADYPARFEEVVDGALPALVRLRDEGLVKAIGVGVNDCGVCLDFLRRAELDCLLLAGRYTLLDRRAEDELLPECRRRGVGVIVGAPFNSGILASPAGHFNHSHDIPAPVRRRLDEIGRLAGDYGVSVRAAALQFPLRDAAVVSVLPGARSRQQLAGLIEAAAEQIPAGFWQEIEALEPAS